jgi:hypothetical protein
MVNKSLDAARTVMARNNVNSIALFNMVVEQYPARSRADWQAPDSEKAPVDDRSPSRSKTNTPFT